MHLGSVPDGARATVAHAAREGFLAGMNEILLLGALLSIAGSLLALLLVREGEIARDETVTEGEREDGQLALGSAGAA